MPIVSATNQMTGITYVNGAAVPKPGVLQSSQIDRIVNLVSEGVIQGLADQVNPLKSVYFNGTPVMDPTTGALNFQGVAVTQAYGSATQTYIPGFSQTESVVSVATVLVHATPLVRTTSTSSVDAVRVTMQYPNGLQSIDGKGNSNTTLVNLTIETKLTSSGTWTAVFSSEATNGKADPGYVKDYYVPRPTGTTSANGTWDVRVTRVTADSATPNTLVNATTWYAMTEIQDVKQAYANSALFALTFDAKNAPSPFPMTFDTYGILCSVPSNYNATTRVYTGVWDGTFTSTKVWTDNPAYHLYELLTNTRFGMGSFISTSQIDLASLYNAGVYNDGLVDDGTGHSTTEPRFRFNGQIASDDDAWKFLQTFASTFNAMLIVTASGLVSVVQDRPTSSSVMVTNAMVGEQGFQYSSGAGATRPTSTMVSFNDVNNGWTLRSIVETDNTTSFPFLQTTAQAWGCTSEGQARRVARWMNDTNLRNTQIVAYRAPLHHLNVTPGTVITIADNFYANSNEGGKVISVSGTTVVLDRPITVTSGTNTLSIRLQDGITLANATITNTAGTYSTVTISATLAQAVTPGADFILTNTLAPQTYRVTDIKEVSDATGYWFEVTAIQYDSTKYSRIETGVSVAAPVYMTGTANQVVPGAVTGLTWVLQAATAIDTVTRDLKCSWTAGANDATYYVQWRKSGDTWTEVQNVGQTSFTIKNVQQGSYDINVYGISAYGLQSAVTSGSYGVDLTGTTTPVINPVTNLQVIGGGTAFTAQDLTVQWTNPSTNANLNPAVKDFVVNVYTSGGTFLRTETVAGVAAGASAFYTYTYAKNQADNANVPIRSIRIDVVARDGLNNLVTATSGTFTNAAPATITLTSTSGYGNNTIKFTRPTDPDFVGYILWASTTSGFSLSTGTKVYEGSADSFVHSGLSDSQTWYYKAAAYDAFGKDYTGTGLNVSSQISSTTSAGATVNEYQLSGVTWTPNSPSANSVAWTACKAVQTLGTGMGATWSITAGNAAWTSGILYIYYVAGNTTLSSTTLITTALGSTSNVIVATYRGGTLLEVGNGNAYTDGSFIIAGTVGATQVVTSGLITNSAQINNALITDAHFTGLLTAAKIDSRGLTIKDASGTVIFSAGVPLAAANITPASGWLNSNVTMSSAGVLSGAGGGTVTVAGLDNSIVRSANPITTGNVSTYISSAAIGSAQVGTLLASNIDTRNLTIKDAAGNIIFGVGTQIGNDAATTLGFNPTFASWASTNPDNWSAWTGVTPVKNTGTVLSGSPYSVDYTLTGSDAGIQRSFVYPTSAPLVAGSYVTGSFSIYMVSNAGGGPPGYLVRLFTNAAQTTYVDNICVIPNQTVSGWQRYPFTAAAGGAAIYAIQIYQMASWSGFPGGTAASGNRMLFGPFTFDINTPVNNAQITPASGWLNSNVTVSGGAIGGIGTGNGTVIDNSYVTPSGIGALAASAASALSATVSISAATGAGFRAGTLTWDSAGARTGGYGVAMTPGGLVGYNSGGTNTFSINAGTGAAYFGGTLAVGTATVGVVSGANSAAATNAGTTTSINSGIINCVTYTTANKDMLVILDVNVAIQTNTNTPLEILLYLMVDSGIYTPGSLTPRNELPLCNTKLILPMGTSATAYNWGTTNNFSVSFIIPAGTFTAASHTFGYYVGGGYYNAAGGANSITGSSIYTQGIIHIREFIA